MPRSASPGQAHASCSNQSKVRISGLVRRAFDLYASGSWSDTTLADELGLTEVFIMVFFSALRGVVEVDEEYVHIARIMGASRWRVLARIILPAALPDIMHGLRMGVPFAMIGAILAEFISSNQGLGG